MSIDRVRVAVARTPQIRLAGNDSFTVYDDGGNKLPSSNITVSLKPGRNKVLFNPGNIASAFVRIVTNKNYAITINNRHYRGTLEVKKEGKRLVVVNILPLAKYLSGVLSNEIPSGWPEAAQKAMAVAARTYAVKKILKNNGKFYHLDSTDIDQVYGGLDTESKAALLAVKSTEGEILTYQGRPILAVYSANCGGKTEEASTVWEASYPYLNSVEDPYCKITKNAYWRVKLTNAKMSSLFERAGSKVAGVYSMRVYARSESGQLKTVEITDRRLQKHKIGAKELRRTLGSKLIKSLKMKLLPQKDGTVFEGRGWGHAVGLCQDGSYGQAVEGRDYHTILRFYYGSDTKLRRLKKPGPK